MSRCMNNNGRRYLLVAWLFMVFAQLHFAFKKLPHYTTASQHHTIDLSNFYRVNKTIIEKEERCAIAFFGLPRAFESLVLPSIEKNVIQPNAAYHCDYFIQYYYLTEEAAGRSGNGGRINPDEILLLKSSILKSANNSQNEPIVAFAMDKDEDFQKQYAPLLFEIRNVTDSRGRLLYFPWRDTSYIFPETTDNIVKMWHSIQHAWQLMETYEEKLNVNYTRVAMLRNDVVYMTPIDIYEPMQGVNGTVNGSAVVPGFGKYPVSDRMIYGPYKAVKVWATERFQRLEKHVKKMQRAKPGCGMHSEQFLYRTLFPAIRDTNTTIVEHDTMCFFRARADQSIWITDCELPDGASRRDSVERILGRKCVETHHLWRRLLDCRKLP